MSRSRRAPVPGSRLRTACSPALNWLPSATPTRRSRGRAGFPTSRAFRRFHASVWEENGTSKQREQTCCSPRGQIWGFSLSSPRVTAGFCLPGRCTGLLSVLSSGTPSCPTIQAHVEGLSLLAASSLPPFPLFARCAKLKLLSVLLNYLYVSAWELAGLLWSRLLKLADGVGFKGSEFADSSIWRWTHFKDSHARRDLASFCWGLHKQAHTHTHTHTLIVLQYQRCKSHIKLSQLRQGCVV